MGDIVDWMFESGMMDMPDDEESEGEWGGSQPSTRTRMCKYCGKQGLKWHNTASGWRLYQGTVVHTCGSYTTHQEKNQ